MGVRAGIQQEHRYQLCNDPFCGRFLCRVYQEGKRAGEAEGHRRGWDEAYPVAYAEGMAACPGPHQ